MKKMVQADLNHCNNQEYEAFSDIWQTAYIAGLQELSVGTKAFIIWSDDSETDWYQKDWLECSKFSSF